MDEEDTRDYKQPCPQCAEVNWGISDEGKFFCKSCHTVIEKTKEADVSLCFAQNTKIQSLSRGIKRKQTNEKGWEWYICEGFQFILLKQAESLQALGLNPMIKDEAMCNFWRRYLQKSRQAYTKRPYMESQTTFRISESSATSSEQDSLSQTISLETSSASESDYMSDSSAVLSSESAASVQTGSIDGASYAKLWKIGDLKMSMPMTVAFCYLSLLWMRESITLSNLLWLIFNDCIPYANAVEAFPEGTKLYGPDIRIFQPRSFPDYEDVMKKTLALGKFLDLPRFPEITEKCFLHPHILCMKYMMEINLPDELHHWTHRIVKKAGLDKPNVLTFDPVHKRNIYYDVEAAAIIIVVLKILFILDDKKEWWISRKSAVANRKNKDKICFDFQKWYNTMKICIDEAKQKVDEQLARYTWITQKALYYSQKSKSGILKKKRFVNNRSITTSLNILTVITSFYLSFLSC
ncbi:TATA box-binding protein-associated factor RNA polymerase I subunit B isoform X2 [Bombina bombina]|uniref:TATA box-binding protein-associated factor RNA polymerase I subunit B isoform X2 n=1 Tax=Bombina bombina TaxID=8345 RepID=UPI00235B0DC9|nr:TATA box-binding protein-associated factor RNA polymerase I subunit B isoform X2 [Bombina bombina]